MDEFITEISAQLRQAGYIIDDPSPLRSSHPLLYARFPERIRLGFASVEEHLLFVDADQPAFKRLQYLKDVYRRFSSFVNRRFRLPHALRRQIPSLVVAAVSLDEFPQEIVSFAQTTSLIPWYGGEIGQIILIDIWNRQVTSLVSMQNGRYPRPGAFPLQHAIQVVSQVCGQVLLKG